MNNTKIISVVTALSLLFAIMSCGGPTIKTTASWANKEKMPEERIKSVFIMAFTDNMAARSHLEEALAVAAQKRGIKTYKSIVVIGPVDMKYVAPVKDVFIKKLEDLKCETVFTVALVDATSETRYVEGNATLTVSGYVPYAYGPAGGYTGYGANVAYGGFNGYYDYAVGSVSSPGYYQTDKQYFLEAKMFDLKSGELLFSIQTQADNPEAIQKSSKTYTETIMAEIKRLGLLKK